MGSKQQSRLWHELTSEEVEGAVDADPVVVLPVASIEQHGPHLPLSTDLVIGLGIVDEAVDALPEDFPTYVLPPLAVGASEEHAGFPGTLSLSPDIMTAVLREIGGALAWAGVRRLVIANSHGGNSAVLQEAGLRLRREEGILVVKATYFRFAVPSHIDLPDSEWRHGLHGGAVETSMMLHLRPDLVRIGGEVERHPSIGEDLEAEEFRRIGPAGEAPFSWVVEDLNNSGVVGDVSLASAEMGGELVAHYAAVMAEVIREAKAFPIERLS